jgi:hypothetical protein
MNASAPSTAESRIAQAARAVLSRLRDMKTAGID